VTLYVSCDHTLAMKAVHYTLRRQAVYSGMFALLLLRCSSEPPPSSLGGGGPSSGGNAGATAATGGSGQSGSGSAGMAVAGTVNGGSSGGHAGAAASSSSGGAQASQGGQSGSAGKGGTASAGKGGTAGAGNGGTPTAAGGGGAASAGVGGSGGSGSAANGGGGTSGSGGSTGGAPATGGSSGNAGAAGSAGGGTSTCSGGTYFVCEDFEAPSLPNAWTARGMVSIATDQAKRGTRSLKIGQAENGERRIVRSAAGIAATHWGRIFYRVEAPTPGVFVHSTLVALEGNGPGIGVAEYRVVDTVQDANRMHQFLWNVQPSGAEFGKGSAYDWRFDGDWHCAEWLVDSANQAYRFFIDSTEVTQIAIANGAGNDGTGDNRTHIPMSFTELRVGWNNYQSASPGFVAWFDELAIGGSRVGCE
jgi:hypothetical protein